jgi:hypothetical protein
MTKNGNNEILTFSYTLRLKSLLKRIFIKSINTVVIIELIKIRANVKIKLSNDNISSKNKIK